jgi:hypothetical protein
LEVILDNEGGADGSGTQDLLEMFDATKPTEGAVLHEKLDSLRRLVLHRDYDTRGRLDKQAWSFDERMLKCEQDARRAEQVNADRAFAQRFHHAGTCSQFHLPSGISGDRAADSASEASAHNARAMHGRESERCGPCERQIRVIEGKLSYFRAQVDCMGERVQQYKDSLEKTVQAAESAGWGPMNRKPRILERMNEMEAKFHAVTRELRDGYVWRRTDGNRKGKAGPKDVAVAHDILAVKVCSMEAQIAELAEAIRRPEAMGRVSFSQATQTLPTVAPLTRMDPSFRYAHELMMFKDDSLGRSAWLCNRRIRVQLLD